MTKAMCAAASRPISVLSLPLPIACFQIAPTQSIVLRKDAAKMKGWAIHRIGELLQWTGAETEREDETHSIVIAAGVSLAEFHKKVPERGVGCRIALVVFVKSLEDV